LLRAPGKKGLTAIRHDSLKKLPNLKTIGDPILQTKIS